MNKDLAVFKTCVKIENEEQKRIAVSLFDIKVAEELILMMIFKNVN